EAPPAASRIDVTVPGQRPAHPSPLMNARSIWSFVQKAAAWIWPPRATVWSALTVAILVLAALMAIRPLSHSQSVAYRLTGSPASSEFGELKVGDSGASRTFTVTNAGSRPLHVQGSLVDGATPEDFQLVADRCSGVILAVGASCVVELRFV